MDLEHFCATLRENLAAEGDAEQRLEKAATGISTYFGVRSHEVGMFRVNEKQHKIEFVWPKGLPANSHIPLNAVNSLVSKTAMKRAASLDNSFAKSRHLFLFEHFLADKNERISVQKVMSAPVEVADKVAGVIQVVRKGATASEAGVDFTAADLAALERIAAVIGDTL